MHWTRCVRLFWRSRRNVLFTCFHRIFHLQGLAEDLPIVAEHFFWKYLVGQILSIWNGQQHLATRENTSSFKFLGLPNISASMGWMQFWWGKHDRTSILVIPYFRTNPDTITPSQASRAVLKTTIDEDIEFHYPLISFIYWASSSFMNWQACPWPINIMEWLCCGAWTLLLANFWPL